MKHFLTSKRKFFDLLILLLLNVVLYFLWSSPDILVLFNLGFIWNWVASQDMSAFFDHKRYRFSMLKLVFNLQSLFLKPFGKFPNGVKRIVGILPIGIFWGLVIIFNNSRMPWWATFLGSATFELIQIELNSIKKHKETSA